MTAQRALTGYCEERHRLLNQFAEAVTELVILHEKQVLALVEGSQDPSAFDVLIHAANQKKQTAKYAYLSHLDTHGCADISQKGLTDLPTP